MEQVKFFFSGISRTGVELEPTINRWLKEAGDTIRVTRATQSNNRELLIVGIYYEPVAPASPGA